MVGLGEFSLVSAKLIGPVLVVVDGGSSLCGIGGGTNFVGEADGLLGIRFWKQSDNWSMHVPVSFILFAEAFVCPMKCI